MRGQTCLERSNRLVRGYSSARPWGLVLADDPAVVVVESNVGDDLAATLIFA